MGSSVKDRTLLFVKAKKLSMKEFEKACNLSSGYVTSMRKGYGQEKLNNVLTAFPDLNREWLVYGEGEMLRSPITQESNGDHNTQVAGNHNHVEPPHGIEKALDEIAEQRKLVSKAQEQIDRLLTVIENLTNTTTKQ